MTMQPLRGTTGGRWSRTGVLISPIDYAAADVLAVMRTHRTELFRYEQHRIVGGVWSEEDQRINGGLWTVLDANLQIIESCTVKYDGHGEHFMTSAQIKLVDDARTFNFQTDAIRVFHLVLMPDGNYVQWMKGTFYAPSPKVPLKFLQLREIDTQDSLRVLFESKITDWLKIPSPPPGGGFEDGDAIAWARKLIYDRYPLAGIDIPDSPVRVGDDPPPAPQKNRSKIYEVGTSILDVINSLLLFAGYETLYANPSGSLVAHPFVKLSLRPVDFTYTADANSLIIRESGEAEQDLWDAPNQWLRVVSRPAAPLLRSRLTLTDPANPLSTSYRGRVVTDFAMIDAPDQAMLDTVVQALYEDGQRVLKTLRVSVPLMPHEHLDKVIFQWNTSQPWAVDGNGVYIIYGWVFPCVPGGRMELTAELAPFSPAVASSAPPPGFAVTEGQVSVVGMGSVFRLGTYGFGYGSEAVSVAVFVSVTDSGAGSTSVLATGPANMKFAGDTGVGTETAIATLTTPNVNDAGSGAELTSVTTLVAAAPDAGAGTEAFTTAASVGPIEAGVGTSATSVFAIVPAADGGVGTESIMMGFSYIRGESGVGSETTVVSGRINVAVGRSYTLAGGVAPHTSYPDTGGIELTDGACGGNAYSDAAWVGFPTNTGGSFDVILDLFALRTVEVFDVFHLYDPGSGIFHPTSIEIFTGLDGVSWTSRGFTAAPVVDVGSRYKDELVTSVPNVRFVKFHVIGGGTTPAWTFLCEVQAYSDVTIPATAYYGFDAGIGVDTPSVGIAGQGNRVTQTGVEVLYGGAASARLTQFGIEVLAEGNNARVTQFGIEVLAPSGMIYATDGGTGTESPVKTP